jgi:hypothetical protein
MTVRGMTTTSLGEALVCMHLAVAALSGTRVAKAQAALTSAQLAGQRVVFSYPGLAGPASGLPSSG